MITTQVNPPTVSPAGTPIAEALGRPEWAAVPGFEPFASPWQPGRGLVCQLLDAPLVLSLPGLVIESLAELSLGLLSHASQT
jgi:hypothetical protein